MASILAIPTVDDRACSWRLIFDSETWSISTSGDQYHYAPKLQRPKSQLRHAHHQRRGTVAQRRPAPRQTGDPCQRNADPDRQTQRTLSLGWGMAPYFRRARRSQPQPRLRCRGISPPVLPKSSLRPWNLHFLLAIGNCKQGLAHAYDRRPAGPRYGSWPAPLYSPGGVLRIAQPEQGRGPVTAGTVSIEKVYKCTLRWSELATTEHASAASKSRFSFGSAATTPIVGHPDGFKLAQPIVEQLGTILLLALQLGQVAGELLVLTTQLGDLSAAFGFKLILQISNHSTQLGRFVARAAGFVGQVFAPTPA